jgi:hypothetical protein
MLIQYAVTGIFIAKISHIAGDHRHAWHGKRIGIAWLSKQRLFVIQ